MAPVIRKAIEKAELRHKAHEDSVCLQLQTVIPIKDLQRLISSLLLFGDPLLWFEEELLMATFTHPHNLIMRRVISSRRAICRRYVEIIRNDFPTRNMDIWLVKMRICNRTCCQPSCCCDEPLTLRALKRRL